MALLAEILHILVTGLGAVSEQASYLSLRVNWDKTKIQRIRGTYPVPQVVHVGPSQVKVVSEFTYLGACTTHDGSSESEIFRRIGIARNCMTLLKKNIWNSSIRVDTKVRLYKVYVLPVLMYPKPGQSLKLLLGDLPPSIHGLCAKSFEFHIPDMLRTLQSGRPPAVVQSPIFFKRDGSASLGRIRLLRRRPDRPVIELGDPRSTRLRGINFLCAFS